MRRYDVGIIGAGIHGASAAYHLISRGLKVVVFEKDTPAAGPTGRSSAICRAYYTNPFLARCARDSIDMFAHFAELTGVDAELRRTGLLFLHPAEDVERVEESSARLNELGIEVDVLEPDAIAERYPMFDLDGIAVAAWERNAGYADASGATHGLFDRAVALGAEARLHARVSSLAPADGGGADIVTADGERTSCARVLVAAGPWTRPLVRTIGIDLPLTVERHIVGVYRWGGAQPTPAHGDLVGGYYFRPEGDELFLVGPLYPAPNVDPDDFRDLVSDG